jgi:hypothetical protein
MKTFKRYAVYYAPEAGKFSDRAAAWLGGTPPDLALPLSRGWAELTKAPRKYGFHGTIRAPFRLNVGVSEQDVHAALIALAQTLPRIEMPALDLVNLHGFLALIPRDPAPLNALAAKVVEATNPLRAPLNPAEIARRRPDTLTPRQRELLDHWGYPFVMEEFQFHLTLSDQLTADEIAPLRSALSTYFAPVLPEPFQINDLCLFGEDDAGAFHLLHRYALAS